LIRKKNIQALEKNYGVVHYGRQVILQAVVAAHLLLSFVSILNSSKRRTKNSDGLPSALLTSP
jgi:hypothetical protein